MVRTLVKIKTHCPICHNSITIPYIEIRRGHEYLHDTFKDAQGNPVRVRVTKIGRSSVQPSYDMTFRITTPQRQLKGYKNGQMFYTSLSHAQLNWKELER